MSTLRDQLFKVAVIIKAADGVLEVIGAALLAVVSVEQISHLSAILTQHELSEDPNDIIATHVLHSAGNFSASSKWFGVLYLLLHGIIKIGLAVALLKNLEWAYRPVLAILCLLTAYQIYRITLTHSWLLAVLTFVDLFIIWMIWQELPRNTAV